MYMEYIEMTREQLANSVDNMMKSASTADKKWVWNYFQEHDKFPIILDEADEVSRSLASGEGTWSGEEECPF